MDNSAYHNSPNTDGYKSNPVAAGFNNKNIENTAVNNAERDVNYPAAHGGTCKPVNKKFIIALIIVSAIVIIIVSTTRKQAAAIECASVKDVQKRNVYCTNRNMVGSTCMFSCNVGNLIQGSKNVTCLATQQWSDKLPVCECPPCTGGPECHSIDWNKLVTYMDGSEKFYYGGNEIECSTKGRVRWRGFKTKWVYHGTCTDVNTRETQQCRNLKSSSSAKKHALANLIKNGKDYPTPCNKEIWLSEMSCDQ